MLSIPNHWEGTCGLKPVQACCFHQSSPANCSASILYSGLKHIFALPMLLWLTHRDINTLNEFKKKHHQLIHSTANRCPPKHRPAFSSHHADTRSSSLRQLWAATGHIMPRPSQAHLPGPSPPSPPPP